MDTRQAFFDQSRACEKLGSPFMARLMTLLGKRLDDRSEIVARILAWRGDPRPQGDNLPLRLAGALHALRIEGLALTEVYPPSAVSDDALWQAILEAFDVHCHRITDWLESAPQTNEVRRSAVILPGLALVRDRYAVPFELLELGTSAGLNLRADKFCVDAGGTIIGGPESKVRLTPDWQGPPPSSLLPDIIARKGVDLNPLDPAANKDVLRLLAYLWPDQPHRLILTRAAIDIAGTTEATIDRRDAGDWLVEQLASPSTVGRLVFHTVAAQYFPPATKAKVTHALQQAASVATIDAPLAHLSMEADDVDRGAAVRLSIWPEGETTLIARADFHGRWIEWLG
jgi:hypothetical protein